MNFFGDISLSLLSVGDCEGEASRGSALSSVMTSMLTKVEGHSSSLRGSSCLSWSTTLPDGKDSRKSEDLGGPDDGLLLPLFVTAERNFDITVTSWLLSGTTTV